MKNKVRKYLIPSLAALLILSNFSFATNLMLCSMKEMDVSCVCPHNGEQDISGLTISKVKKSCCNEEVVLLSNSNVLNIVKLEASAHPLVVLYYINNDISENISSANLLFSVNLQDKIPKKDIPIIISSLLI